MSDTEEEPMAKLAKVFTDTAVEQHSVPEDVKREGEHCVSLYEKVMKKAFESTRNKTEFVFYEKKARNDSLQQFCEHNKDRNENQWISHVKVIEEAMRSQSDNFLFCCICKWPSQADITNQASFEAKQIYDEQMTAGFPEVGYMDETKLKDLHTLVKQKTFTDLEHKFRLTDLRKEDIDAALKASFAKFKERNLMYLPKDHAIGIDLGTTQSCVAVFNQKTGQVVVINNRDSGQNTTPSYVAFDSNEMATVGDVASRRAPFNVENTVFDAKRMIGRRFDDKVLQNDIRLWPFKVIQESNCPKIKISNSTYYPEEISAKILQELKRAAESYLGCEVKKAVITVPAYFSDGQRQATIDAGEIAGLEVLRIINEPTAAAIAYNLQYMKADTRNVMVYDLGGGTFDVAVLEMKNGEINVKSVDGDCHLGGADFDNKLVDYCVKVFKEKTKIDLVKRKKSENAKTRAAVTKQLARLKQACEQSKKIICINSSGEDIVSLDSIADGNDLHIPITKAIFEDINGELFKKTIKVVERALKSIDMPKSAVEEIILVGGSTRIPKVRALIKEYFGENVLLSHRINPDEAVAQGAALEAAILNGQICKGGRQFIKIQDVLAFSIGVQSFRSNSDEKGFYSVIIPKNTTVPRNLSAMYHTLEDDQTLIEFNVYQGENLRDVSKNTLLGNIILKGIPPSKACEQKAKVEMKIDDEGILHATATCVSNGVSKSLDIDLNKGRLARATVKELRAKHNPSGPM